MTESKLVEEQKKTFLEEAKQERERIEKALEENKNILAKMEEIKAQEMMSGKTDAGQVKEKPKEESPSEYAKRIMNGGK